MTQPGAKRIAIHMLRDVGADQFSGALADGIRDNHSEAEMKALEPRVAQLGAILAEMKEAKKGMVITLDLVPAAARRSRSTASPRASRSRARISTARCSGSGLATSPCRTT